MTEPVLTVTANSALDRCILVEDFAFGKTVVARRSALAMAGKPADMSLVLAELGVPSHATGLAGGRTGRLMVRMLERAGVSTSFLWVPGRTRVNVVIVKEGTGLQGTVTVPSLRPTEADGEALARHVQELLPGRRWLLLGGSLPEGVRPDLYRRLIEAAHACGIQTLLDAGGKTLQAALPARPSVVKPNQVELGLALGRELRSLPETIEAARQLIDQSVGTVVVTLGGEGAICLTAAEGWYVPPLRVPVVNTAGAGDAFAAGLVKGLLAGEPLALALRWAAAAATAVLLTLRTAHCRRRDVLRLLPQVQVLPLSQALSAQGALRATSA